MKRDIIKISDYAVSLTGDNVWMTYWEMAEAFNVVPTSVNRAIKKLFKEGILSEHEHGKYIRLKNGYHAYIYSLDVVIALSFKFNTYFTTLFRQWLTGKAKEHHPPIFISISMDACSDGMIICSLIRAD